MDGVGGDADPFLKSGLLLLEDLKLTWKNKDLLALE